MKQRLIFLLTIAFTTALMGSIPAWAIDNNLPNRSGSRPATTAGIPHMQIGVKTAPMYTERLLQKVAAIPGVELRETNMSLPGAKGFWLSEKLTLARPDGLVRGREFAHVHPDGSLHASLSPKVALQAAKAGWAIHHPWADQRPGWNGFVMIYIPRTKAELDVVFQLVLESYSFITGQKMVNAN